MVFCQLGFCCHGYDLLSTFHVKPWFSLFLKVPSLFVRCGIFALDLFSRTPRQNTPSSRIIRQHRLTGMGRLGHP